MSSNPIPLIPGSHIGDYALIEPLGSSVDLWRAEDVRTGGPVALKILSRALASNPARRQEVIDDLRQKAALRHPHLVSIREVGGAGDVLFMTMEVVQGEALSHIVRRGLPNRKQLFRLAYELIAALEYLHERPLVHGSVAGDSVLLTRNGGVKLVGFSLANLMGERGQESARRRLLDPGAVAFMAPEAIRGAPLDRRSDLFSFGCVMYEALTGRPPFAGANAAEIASAVLSGQPVSPMKIRPDADADAVAIIGLCLFKDPERRPQSAGQIRKAILKAAPELASVELPSPGAAPVPEPRASTAGADLPIHPSDLLRQARVPSPPPLTLLPPTAVAAAAPSHDGVIWVAELSNFSELEAHEPSRARKAAARMQQILGEAAHLFDGTVSDTGGTGARMVAEMPDATRAYQAGLKGELDLADVLDGLEPKPLVRMVLHAGTLTGRGEAIAGDAVEEVADTLTTVPPGRLFMTERFVQRSGGTVTAKKAAGVPGPLYVGTATGGETAEATAVMPDENSTIAIHPAPGRKPPKEPAETTVIAAAKPRYVIVVGGAILILLAAAAVWFSSHREAPPPPPPVASEDALPTRAHPRTIALSALTAEVADPALSERAARTRAAAVEILRAVPQLRVSPAAVAGADLFGARVLRSAAGDQIIPLHPSGRKKVGEAAAFDDAASGARSLVGWICTQLQVPPPAMTSSKEALNHFADAAAAYEGGRPASEVDRALKAALSADPGFVPTQMFAMRVYSERRDLRRAADYAREVLRHDAGNVGALALMARFSAAAGDPASSIGYWNLTLENDPRNVAAINALGRYALAGTDAAIFQRALARLREAGAGNRGELHEPDLLVASGKIDAAVEKYYDVELREPENPALSLVIGRFAVLRHSTAIADIELKKLERLDPAYATHILAAYIAAQGGQKGRAASELEQAARAAAMGGGGDLHTSAAEIAAMTGDGRAVVTSLQKALDESEPTAGYILSDPLFVYLRSDPAFQAVRDALVAQQEAIRSALQRVKL
jgi:serine/threonine protein kinase/tetratricopeptide (TPR) repeat protein